MHDDGIARDALGRRGIELSVGRGDEEMKAFFDSRTDALLSTTMSFGAAAVKRGIGTTTTALTAARFVPEGQVPR